LNGVIAKAVVREAVAWETATNTTYMDKQVLEIGL
jgi:hypothetical protein